jgi:hypothetical protein
MRSLIVLAAICIASAQTPQAFLQRYCLTCHNQKVRTAGLALDGPALSTDTRERVIAKLHAGSMPPPGNPRPPKTVYNAVAATLENEIDQVWKASTTTPKNLPVHRLNRVEYNNAVNDLLALNVDIKNQLPGDETADGSFDNFANSLTISTAHLERYLSVARQLTRLAVGIPPPNPKLEKFDIPLHVLQDDRQSEDLPLGSRGGIAIRTHFPTDGEYLVKVRLQRQYQDYLKGIGWPQKLDIHLDGELIQRFIVGGEAKGRPAAASYAGDGEPGFAGDPEWERYMQLTGDAGLEVRFPAKAGPRLIGVSFVRQLYEPEGLPQPLQRGRVIANDQVYMDHANVGSVLVGGPYQPHGIAKGTPSRKALFPCYPANETEELPCAEKILAKLARQAYRRPVTKADIQTLLPFFRTGREEGRSFDHGIQFALERLLVDPDFLLRLNRRPDTLTDIELASRLSFFLWSTIPDEKLLELAERNILHKPLTLQAQVRRMLADPRASRALTANFAAQWLNLRRIPEVVVDPIRYPQYDESLLQAFQQETELFVQSNIQNDRPLPELLNATYTFVNERLARHYKIPGIYGSRFRKVELPDAAQRGGLLAHGALLATTSYPDRTSPVLRGKWLLNNILGRNVPPPPAGVDTNLEAKAGAPPATIRQRLEQHRQNPSCNSCHSSIDPLGFALENFDVIGAWRTRDESGKPVDSTGATTAGEPIAGLQGLRNLLLSQPEQFPRTVVEKLLAYALGRKTETADQPAIRQIVRDAEKQNYRWSALIEGITQSPAFRMEPR